MFTILAMTCSAMRMFSPVAQGAPRTTMREAHGPMYWPTMALLPANPPVARITPPLVISSTRRCFSMQETPSTLKHSSVTSSTAFVL